MGDKTASKGGASIKSSVSEISSVRLKGELSSSSIGW
jgi:hypothetical protein